MDNEVLREEGKGSATKSRLKSVHVCTQCGATTSREDMTEEAMISGVLECPKCGLVGPLNVSVVRA